MEKRMSAAVCTATLTLLFAVPAWAQTPPTTVDTGWGDKFVSLAQVGFMGVAVALAMLAAWILVFGKRETEAQAKSVRQFLIFATVLILVSAGVEVWKTRNFGTVIVQFSPKFDDDLPQPVILIGTLKKGQGEVIDISADRTLNIVLDDALKKIRSLSNTNQYLASTNQTKQQTILQLAAQNPLSGEEGQ